MNYYYGRYSLEGREGTGHCGTGVGGGGGEGSGGTGRWKSGKFKAMGRIYHPCIVITADLHGIV